MAFSQEEAERRYQKTIAELQDKKAVSQLRFDAQMRQSEALMRRAESLRDERVTAAKAREAERAEETFTAEEREFLNLPSEEQEQ